jgi:hypothetical protein
MRQTSPQEQKGWDINTEIYIYIYIARKRERERERERIGHAVDRRLDREDWS